MEDKLLTPEQTAELLGVTTGTLANWRSKKSKKLSYVQLGGVIRYKQSQVQSFIDKGVKGE